MAKYVCDFDTVISAGQSMIQAANELSSSTTTYSSKIESDLSSWAGTAKDSFTTKFSSQIEDSTKRAQEVSELGEYIVTAAQSIQQLDETLASVNI